MKKISIFIICFASLFLQSNAFFGGSSQFSLYGNIDRGIIKLENNITDFEIQGGNEQNGIIEELNNFSILNEMNECLDNSQEMSLEDFYEIIDYENIILLSSFINENCMDSENESYSTEILNDYLELFKNYKFEKRNFGETKTKKMYQIANVGIFSDGDIENSGFDLINDIEEIDSIIFASKEEYEGSYDNNFNDDLERELGDFRNDMKELENDYQEIKNLNITVPIKNKPENIVLNPINNELSIYSKYVCSENQNNSGLTNLSNDFLINDIENKITINNNSNSEEKNTNTNINYQSDNDKKNDNIQKSNYKKVTDNSEFPCNTFFCIDIEFIMYEHNLFGGGENVTIEYLLNRSNEHLKKIAATSLIPAKMTNNLFELGLKDLNLPDIFHMGFQISTKPVPILNIQSEGEKDTSLYTGKSLFETYYKTNGLNYERRNDLVLLRKIEQDKQNLNNSAGLTNNNVMNKWNELNNILEEKGGQEKIDFINRSISKKVSYGTMQNFERQYNELEKFNVGINNYIKNLDSLIKAIGQIPIDKS